MMPDPFVQVTRVRQSRSQAGLLVGEIMVVLHSSIYVMQPDLFRLLSVMKFWLDRSALNGA
jgi:hypothetical protein